MNYRMVAATEQDGAEMLDIIETLPSKGLFELLYTRRPNPFLSHMAEFKDTDVYVIKDKNDKIILQVACSPHSLYINGHPAKLGYINGVKKRVDFNEKINWLEMICNTKTKVEYDYHYCSILQANKHAQQVFEKKRTYMTDMHYICNYTTFIVKPKKRKIMDNSYIFRRANKSDESAIIDFLSREGQGYDLFPYFDSISDFHGLYIEDFYLLEKEGVILCTCALWEQASYKQYIVKQYNSILKLASKIPYLPKILGYISLPEPGKILRFPILTLFMAKNDDEKYYKAMLSHIENVVYESYGMFLIGLTESSNKYQIFLKKKSLRFISRLYLFISENPPVFKKVHVECGML